MTRQKPETYYYIYVLQSEKDGHFYVGYTKNLLKRMQEHHAGKVMTTNPRRPLKLIYWEGCLNQSDALKREKYLKTSWGKRYIKNRIQVYLTGQGCKHHNDLYPRFE